MNKIDQEAIKHIASVSKHPHAEIICKWLVTGWEVKFRNTQTTYDWNIVKYPTWDEKYEYKLIEPNPARPAYRVYIEPGDKNPAIVQRSTYYIDYKSYDGKVEWISDWIEYGPPKKWTTPLVERIAAIDIKAAEWIVEHWDELLEDRYTRKGVFDRESHLLSYCFDWCESNIDANIWENISTKLGE